MVAAQAREEQARNSAGALKTAPVSTTAPAAAAAAVPRGELPIDQVLSYINGEPTGARKGKKTQKKRK